MQISQMTSAPLPWLSILVALPALGALMLAMVPALRRAGRTFALILSVCELAAAIVAFVSAFDWSSSSTYQLSEAYSWIPQMGLSWALAVNALGAVMILLAVAWSCWPVGTTMKTRQKLELISDGCCFLRPSWC